MIQQKDINHLRKLHRTPVKDIQAALGVSATQTTNLLHCRSEMSLKQFITCCQVIGVDVRFSYNVDHLVNILNGK